MYCGKCGMSMDDGAMFCPNCGAPAGESNEQYRSAGDQNTYYAGMNVKHKSHKGLFAGVIAAAAVVVIGVVAVFAAPALKSTFMSPASYYRDVELNSLGSGLDMVEGILNEVSSIGNGMSGSVELEVSDSLLSMFGSGMANYIGDVNSAGVDIDFSNGKDTVGIDMTLRLEKTEICELEMICDSDAQKVYLGLPGLSDSYAETDFDDMGLGDINLNALSSLNELPKGSDVSDVAETILKAALKRIDKDNVKREKGSVAVGSVTQSCTIYTVTLDDETLNEMMIAALSTAKNDSDLKSVAYEFVQVYEEITGESVGYSKSELGDMIEDSLDELIDEVDFSGFELTYGVYVDSSGNVLGREFYDEAIPFKTMSAQNGKNYAFEYTAELDGDVYLLSGEGTKNGDKFTGDVYLSVEGMDLLEMKMSDYEFDGKNMTSSGSMEISLGSAASYIFDSMRLDSSIETMLKTIVLAIDFDVNKNSSEFEIEVSAGGMELGKISLNGKMSSSYSPKVPKNIYSGDVEDYIEDLDMEELADRLEDAGIPSMITSQLRYIY